MILVIIFILVVFATVLLIKNKKYKQIFSELQNLKVSMASITEKNNSLVNIKDEYDSLKEKIDEKQVEISELKSQKLVVENSLNTVKDSYNELKQLLANEQQKVQDYILDIKKYVADISKLEAEQNAQQKAIAEKEQNFKSQFENLATKIFDDNSKKQNIQNQESLNNVLNPVREQLKDFKQKVEDVYDKENKGRIELTHELKTLKELNQRMSEEAHNLTVALKGDKKKQGNWGEIVLERVLENSGLRKDQEYIREVTLKDSEDNKFRPDVIIKLPDNRDIVVDAKTSLNAYNNYISATDEITKKAYLKEHILAIKNHINSLAVKDYEKLSGINSLDFIFMFIPIENALMLALENDTTLYDNAFKQKIILVSPTTLLLALKVVENTWKYERQAKSISDIYGRAELLYSKFVGFIDDLEKIGKALTNANKSYDEAFGKLKTGSGNLIMQVETLKQVSNITPKKELKSDLVQNAIGQS